MQNLAAQLADIFGVIQICFAFFCAMAFMDCCCWKLLFKYTHQARWGSTTTLKISFDADKWLETLEIKLEKEFLWSVRWPDSNCANKKPLNLSLFALLTQNYWTQTLCNIFKLTYRTMAQVEFPKYNSLNQCGLYTWNRGLILPPTGNILKGF